MSQSNEDIMRRVHRVSNLYRRGFSESGEPPSSTGAACHQGFGRVLSLLVRQGDGVSQAAMAEHLNIRPQSLSESLAKMEERGYIRRSPNPQDKRGTLVYLTEAGRAQETMLAEQRRRAADALLSVLDEDERQTLSALLNKILDGRA